MWIGKCVTGRDKKIVTVTRDINNHVAGVTCIGIFEEIDESRVDSLEKFIEKKAKFINIEHKHGPYACTCYEIRDNLLLCNYCEPI